MTVPCNSRGRSLALRIPAVLVLLSLGLSLAADPAQAETRRQREWHLAALGITQVHQVSKGKDVVVGVVDTGVDASHPDLAGRIIPGIDLYDSNGNGQTDKDGHGTSMAGIIAGTGSGTDGILGIAPEAKILPVKITDRESTATAESIKLGIQKAVDHGAKVINVSWATATTLESNSIIDYALSKDVVIVAGAGNTSLGQTEVCWPANTSGVIAVTATDRSGSFWSGSAKGPEAVVSAPGTDIISTSPRELYASGYNLGEGTSASSAIVSGIAALIRAKYPNMSAANVINRMIRTADDAGPSGRDPQYGYGKVNALKALTQDVPEVKSNPLITASESTGSSPSANSLGMVYATNPPSKKQSKNGNALIYTVAGVAALILTLTAFRIRARGNK